MPPRLRPGSEWPSSPPWGKLVHLELACASDDPRVVEILRFPAGALAPPGARRSLALWADGTASGGRRKLDAFLAELRKGANEALEVLTFDPYTPPGAGFTLTGIEMRLKISPMNRAWAPLPDWGATREGDRVRANLAAHEQWVRFHRLTRYPSVFEAILTYESAASPETVAHELAPLLAGAFPEEIMGIPILGTGSVGAMHQWAIGQTDRPQVFQQIGERFPGLERLVVGPADRAAGLAQALGVEAHVGTVGLAVLSLPDSVLRDPAARARAAAWLPSEEQAPPRRELDSSAGELRVGPNVLYTERRRRELLAEGAIPNAPPPLAWYSIIAPEYCRMLGIDPDDMVVTMTSEMGVRLAREETDRAFRQLPEDLPLAERVWRAHLAGFSKVGLRSEIAELVRQRYFAERMLH